MSLIQVPTNRQAFERRQSSENANLSDLGRAIIAAVAYADIFDYPLTSAEIHRYLVGVSADMQSVQSALDGGALVPAHLTRVDDYFALAGRESVIETRQRRSALARRFWPRALFYGRLIASLPFVRMVAITGELAVDNADRYSDIDFFIVTEPGRLWLCRALTVALVRSARLRGDTICPNYVLSETALELDNRTLYTAHELTQMVPLSGSEVYGRMRRLNQWSSGYLPNADGPPRLLECRPIGKWATRLTESMLRGSLGSRLERWEMERKIKKLSRDGGEDDEIAFSADWCKGHFDGHGRKTLAEYADRLHRVEGSLP